MKKRGTNPGSTRLVTQDIQARILLPVYLADKKQNYTGYSSCFSSKAEPLTQAKNISLFISKSKYGNKPISKQKVEYFFEYSMGREKTLKLDFVYQGSVVFCQCFVHKRYACRSTAHFIYCALDFRSIRFCNAGREAILDRTLFFLEIILFILTPISELIFN